LQISLKILLHFKKNTNLGTINFSHHNVPAPLKDKLFAKTFLASIFAKEEVDFKSISYIFCTDEYLLALNKQYLSHDALTDILTFTLSNLCLPLVSEIYISVERVRENAIIQQVDFLNELYRVMIHGILHLCGYNDRTASEKMEMRDKEKFYLKKSLLF
jgi:probable rRNA maturation factor